MWKKAKPKSRFRISIGAFLSAGWVMIGLLACVDGVVYDKYNHTGLSGWDKADSLFYDVEPVPSAGLYKQEVGLRINDEFPFTDLMLVVDQLIEPGHRLVCDTLACKITDNEGMALGHGVGCYQYGFVVSELNLGEGDSLHISIRHIMKREIMPGISDVGLRLSRVE